MANDNLKAMNSWALWAIVAMSLGPLAVMPIASNANLAQQTAPVQDSTRMGPQIDAPMSPEGAAV